MATPSRTLGQFMRPNHQKFSYLPTRRYRFASTSANSPSSRFRNLVYGSGTLAVVSLGYIYVTDTRASVHRYVAVPLVRTLFPDAEDAHHFGTALLKELWTLGLYPRERSNSIDNGLTVEVFGHTLKNPMGISGGLDKNGEIPDSLFAIGSGVVEIGGVTPRPQPGNEKPRVFRVPSQDAIINRYGLNSEGADVVAMRLRQRVREYAYKHGLGIDQTAEDVVLNGGAGVPPGSLTSGRLLAVQIAKNKLTPDSDLDAVVQDHVDCVQKLGKYADILVVNVSSPNTPGLRALQSKQPLTRILSAVVDAANATDRKTKPVVMVKVSPDESSDTQIQGIVDAVWESGVAGVIAGNTTTKRPDVSVEGREVQTMLEMGGFSGPPLFQNTPGLIRKYRKALDAGPSETSDKSAKGNVFDSTSKVIFASGGITNGEQALEVLNAGASVAMCYTGVVYGGVGTISRIKTEMQQIIALRSSK